MNSALADAPDAALPTRRFTRSEYERLAAEGFFEDEKVELLNGEIVPMTPQGRPHWSTVARIDALLQRALDGRAHVLVQSSLPTLDDSMPEPDIAVLPIDTDLDAEGPVDATCVIEVSVTSQRRDRLKVPIYARAGVPQLVIIDVTRREARVYRGPKDGEYDRVETLREGQPLALDAFPDVAFDLAAVLPRG